MRSCTVRPGISRRRASLKATPRARKRLVAGITRSASSLVPARQSSASVLSLAPAQERHGVYARYRESSTRTCILYALVSSHLKKRETPYQTPGHDLRQLTHSFSP